MIVVHLVHGTFPYGFWRLLEKSCPTPIRLIFRLAIKFYPCSWREHYSVKRSRFRNSYWFYSGSPFEETVRKALASAGYSDVRFVRFFWSGRNSFNARNIAAKRLRQQLMRWNTTVAPAHQFIVAHSHGGTIAAEALDIREPEAVSLADGLLTIATPFIRRYPVLSRSKMESYFRSALAAFSPLVWILGLIILIYFDV